MEKRDEIEPLYAGLKEAQPTKLSLPVRLAITVLGLLLLFWIVWLQAH
ncbi:MAG: hypothetical protein JNK02_17910 [Planctomycetes bacterium]|nr:hypothetical protein [Planctomycetota bacterium]